MFYHPNRRYTTPTHLFTHMDQDPKGTTGPDHASNVKRTRIGVWDLYEEKQSKLDAVPYLATVLKIIETIPFVRRMLKDLFSISGCRTLLAYYVILQLVMSLVPAVTLWYSGQLIKIVQASLEKRTIDTEQLVRITAGRVGCVILSNALRHIQRIAVRPLAQKIKQYYSIHTFHAMARLDLPTFGDPIVEQQLQSACSAGEDNSVPWTAVTTTCRSLSTFLELTSQISVLISVLNTQRDGLLLAILCFGPSIMNWLRRHPLEIPGAWVATTKDADLLRSQGFKRVVGEYAGRKEIVAGNLSGYLTNQYEAALRRLGYRAGDFIQSYLNHQDSDVRHLSRFVLLAFLDALPQVIFTLRAVQYPASIPVSLASLDLVRQATTAFSTVISLLLKETSSIADAFDNVRKLYEIASIPNKVLDGGESFPEDRNALFYGLSIEFRNVSFKYPGSDDFALRNVSFRIEPGQLCVIVGPNGSGKSTILKLILRLHDPLEGTILVNDRDIRVLKLADLRKTMSVLFQDYTIFPLSIGENIGLGDPANAHDESKIRAAAALGGAQSFIDRLPDGFETYSQRPVNDYYSRMAKHHPLRNLGLMNDTGPSSLSGGQMQRLALSRTFMRSLVSTEGVGVLLFDEPSASLDPAAEHDLFERLCNLRGNKTMVFSSHRFGRLTKHADLILFMNDSVIIETGTHSELLKQDGEYAKIWGLQVQAFL